MASAHNNSIGVTGNGYQDIFVAKINSAGNWEWATSAGGVSYDEPITMVGLSGGSALVTGYFYGQGATFGSRGITNSGGNEIFVAKIGSTGNWEWAASAGGVDYDYPVSMVGLGDGSALVTGYFTSNATFYSTSVALVVDPLVDIHAEVGFLIAALQSRYRYRVIRKSRNSINF